MDQLDNMDLSVSFLRDRVRSASMNSPELLDDILGTKIGAKFSNISAQRIDPKPFKDFKARHKSTNYSRIFQQKKLNNRRDYFRKTRKVKKEVIEHYVEDKKCKDQAHPAQIREGFRTVLFKVVSQKLIGNNGNKKKILKALYNLMRTAKTEPFTLRSLVKQLNV